MFQDSVLAYYNTEYIIIDDFMNKSVYSSEHDYVVKQLINARKLSGLQQRDVARLLGKTQSYISEVEAGQRRIDVVQLKRFAEIDAVKLLALDLKVFENYFKNAGEFSAVERKNGRGRFVFEKNSLLRWLEGYRWRSAELTVDDYALCLDFALAMHFRGYVLSDWGTARQREFGQKITNWVKGQLGEIALKKFLKNEFGVQIELDFSNIQRDCSAGYYRCRGGGTHTKTERRSRN